MGIYVNPTNGQSKEDFLLEHGEELSDKEKMIALVNDETNIAVCLVDNGTFSAAVVMYSEREVEEVINPDEHRPKTVYSVAREVLIEKGGVSASELIG